MKVLKKLPPKAKRHPSRDAARRAAIRSGLTPKSFWLFEVQGGGWSYEAKKPIAITDPAELAIWKEMIAIGYPEIGPDGNIVNEPWKSNHLRNSQ